MSMLMSMLMLSGFEKEAGVEKQNCVVNQINMFILAKSLVKL